MSWPLDSYAQMVYNKLRPATGDDARNNYALAKYIEASCLGGQDVDTLVAESANMPPWSRALDIDLVPAAGIPWLAQMAGVTIDTTQSESAQRTQAKTQGGFRRGRPASIAAAAQATLTGSKTVTIRERVNGDAYALTVITRTAETPDSAKTLAAILKEKPAGLVLTYSVLTGTDYAGLLSEYATYAIVFSTFTTYGGVLSDVPGT